MIRKCAKDRVVWKKAWVIRRTEWGIERVRRVIVKLLLRKGTRYHRDKEEAKCRAESLKVIGFEDEEGNPVSPGTDVRSDWDLTFQYVVGTVVEPTYEFSRQYQACASGIHFFRHRDEAVDYYI